MDLHGEQFHEEQIAHRGTRLLIVYADSGRRNRLLARTFWEGLRDSRARRIRAKAAKFKHTWTRLGSGERLRDTTTFTPEPDGIWALKAKPYRIYAFQHRQVWYLTHGAVKKSNDLDPKEIETAKAIRDFQLRQIK